MIEAINQIYKHRKDFILIGLTGKIGSGCTTTADFLSKKKNNHNLPKLCISSNSTDIDRKKYIIRQHYEKNWVKFEKIIASDVITSYLLEFKFDDIQNFLKENSLIQFPPEFKDKYNEFFKEREKFRFKKKGNDVYNYITNELHHVSKEIKDSLSKTSYRNYSQIYQKFGDNLRLYGNVLGSGTLNLKNVFVISKRINQFVKIIKNYKFSKKKEAYIVIDAFRNPIEIMFFKERYSAFYIFSINAEQKHIEDRLSRHLKMSILEIEKQDEKENPKDIIDKPENFVSQNIKACIQKSDIHIANNGMYGNSYHHELYGQIIKYISLIQHPGLITPSLDEKMMQVAHTAKLNSACLSRQVGASITNEYGSLKAIGWNSVADGQTPCLLRSKDELIKGTVSNSFSLYEKSEKFKKAIIDFYPNINNKNLKGRNQSF